MNQETFHKAYQLQSKIADLEIIKKRIKDSQLITMDITPFWGFSGGGLIEDIKEEVSQISEQLNEKFIAAIDNQIAAAKKEFESI